MFWCVFSCLTSSAEGRTFFSCASVGFRLLSFRSSPFRSLAILGRSLTGEDIAWQIYLKILIHLSVCLSQNQSHTFSRGKRTAATVTTILVYNIKSRHCKMLKCDLFIVNKFNIRLRFLTLHCILFSNHSSIRYQMLVSSAQSSLVCLCLVRTEKPIPGSLLTAWRR